MNNSIKGLVRIFLNYSLFDCDLYLNTKGFYCKLTKLTTECSSLVSIKNEDLSKLKWSDSTVVYIKFLLKKQTTMSQFPKDTYKNLDIEHKNNPVYPV